MVRCDLYWWWNVGFTPRAIRHVHPYRQLSSLGAQSNLWVLSLRTASWGAHPLGTFQKLPLISPLSTTSGNFLCFLWIQLFPLKPSPRASLFLSNQPLLLPFFFKFPFISHVVGSLLSPLDLSKLNCRGHRDCQPAHKTQLVH